MRRSETSQEYSALPTALISSTYFSQASGTEHFGTEELCSPTVTSASLTMSCLDSQKTGMGGKNADSPQKQVIFRKSTRDKAVSMVIMGLFRFEFYL